MREDVAKLWAEMLRSGKYKQCEAQLAVRDYSEAEEYSGYCCLGVLSVLHKTVTGENFIYHQAMPSASTDNWAGVTADSYSITITHESPQELHKLAIEIWNKSVEKKHHLDVTSPKISLATLNDHLKWDFNKIADFIEKYWEYL
jgi:hypothetical protein